MQTSQFTWFCRVKNNLSLISSSHNQIHKSNTQCELLEHTVDHDFCTCTMQINAFTKSINIRARWIGIVIVRKALSPSLLLMEYAYLTYLAPLQNGSGSHSIEGGSGVVCISSMSSQGDMCSKVMNSIAFMIHVSWSILMNINYHMLRFSKLRGLFHVTMWERMNKCK